MKSEELRRALHLRDQLFNLVQVDADAVGLYDAAIEHVIDEEIYSAFRQFQIQHREHVNELCRAIQRVGWATPEFRVDLKGHIGEIGVRLGCLRGTTGALQVVSIAEKTHCARYAEAQEWEIGDSRVMGLLRVFGEDEKDHLAFVERAMAQVGVSGS
jgi:hypothetical protein